MGLYKTGDTRMKKNFLGAAAFFLVFLIASPAFSGESAKIHTTILVASSNGQNAAPINEAYGAQLAELFSYSNYTQAGVSSQTLEKSKRVMVDLPDGYKLILTLQDVDKKRVQVQAVIRKGNIQFMDTVVSILRPGVVFLGGPPAQEGVLIIVLETTF